MPERLRVLVWAKTYPELSTRHAETVCTGAVTEAGAPIRLYPVPFRYLEGDQRYRLFDWIEVDATPNRADTRPESRKIVPETLRLVGHIAPTPRDGWRARAEVLFRDPSWQFNAVADLKAAQAATGRSMGILRVGRVERVYGRARSARERAEYEAKRLELAAQADLFRPEALALDFVPYELRIAFRCAESCDGCTTQPHDMKVLDWGLQQLIRRDGIETARARLTAITDMQHVDLRLFMGNFAQHPHTFGIIGLWYPPIPAQPLLL